jgi:endoglucanase
VQVQPRSGLRGHAAAAVLLVMTALLGACGGADSSGPPAASSTSAQEEQGSAADRFLSNYVGQEGQVVRRDQGGDVVSEGQAYGMLIAQSAGRDRLAATIWDWTRSHLQRPDGLLAFHADADGKVLDQQPAADADTLAAYALLRARGAQARSMHAAGRQLATAVLHHQTLRDGSGGLVLAAGPWAVHSGVVNPSYWMPEVFTDLAQLTGDARWRTLATTSVDLVDQLTDGGRILPSDWARVAGNHAMPAGVGGGNGTPQYGADAQRVPLWFATSCDTRAQHLAGAWWSILQQDNRSAALTLTPTGDPVDGSASAVALLASAASADAAGDSAGAAQLRTGASQSDQGQPTYYGAAWLALDHMLRHELQHQC